MGTGLRCAVRSAAYAVAEAAGWPGSLDARLDKGEGAAFYAIIGAATMGGVALCFTRSIRWRNCSGRRCAMA